MKAPVSFFTYWCLVGNPGSHRLPTGGGGVCRWHVGQLHTSYLQQTGEQTRAVVDPDLCRALAAGRAGVRDEQKGKGCV